MKNITMIVTSWCPHCERAKRWIEEVRQENPKYKAIQVKIIDEEKQPEISKQYDYYFVPTYYVENNKIYEGGTTKDIVRKVFEEAAK